MRNTEKFPDRDFEYEKYTIVKQLRQLPEEVVFAILSDVKKEMEEYFSEEAKRERGSTHL